MPSSFNGADRSIRSTMSDTWCELTLRCSLSLWKIIWVMQWRCEPKRGFSRYLCSSWPLLEKMTWWRDGKNNAIQRNAMIWWSIGVEDMARPISRSSQTPFGDTFCRCRRKWRQMPRTEMTRYILDLDMAGRENLSSRRFIAQYGSGWRQCWSGYRKRSPKDTTAFSFSRQIISLASRQIFATCKPKWRNPQLNFFGRYNEW